MAQFSKGWGSKIFTVRFGLGTFNNDPPSAPKLPDNHFGCYTLHQFNGQLGALSLAVIAFCWAFTSDIDDPGGGWGRRERGMAGMDVVDWFEEFSRRVGLRVYAVESDDGLAQQFEELGWRPVSCAGSPAA